LYSSPEIIKLNKKCERGGTCRTYGIYIIHIFLLGGPKGRDHWEDLGVGGRITLRWTLGK